MTTDIYIGLMSGTSMDGVDGIVLVLPPHIQQPSATTGKVGNPPFEVLAHTHRAIPANLRSELIALNTAGMNELHRAALAGNSLSQLYADVVLELLQKTQLKPSQVAAIGAHGQTVRHQPGQHDGVGYTLQLSNPALLAERTQITVVADFRSRDIAAGGQGAPLVPAFHQFIFAAPNASRCILNIGGISNLTVLPVSGNILGFDCGPGNALMDYWCHTHTGQDYDEAGAWAASGVVIPELLAACLEEPYFQAPPPKSTGRDIFNPSWLQKYLDTALVKKPEPNDVQATLAELTAITCANSAMQYSATGDQVAACGGGAFNTHLMRRIQMHMPGRFLKTTASIGLEPMQVECAAFAWLAQQALQRLPASVPSVTGASSARILGAIYYA